jgi:hypothetical protein
MLPAAQAIGRKEDWRMPSSATAAFVHIDSITAPCNREIEIESNLIKHCPLDEVCGLETVLKTQSYTVNCRGIAREISMFPCS